MRNLESTRDILIRTKYLDKIKKRIENRKRFGKKRKTRLIKIIQ